MNFLYLKCYQARECSATVQEHFLLYWGGERNEYRLNKKDRGNNG